MKILFLSVLFLMSCNEQRADLSFDTSVAHPTYTGTHPLVLFDEAHRNFHTTDGRYAPFANLLRNDGYIVQPNHEHFTKELLQPFAVLVIANAMGQEDKFAPAFDERETAAVEEWVREGGSLLLIADHYPMGSAAEALSERFGVHMGKGYVADSINYEGSGEQKDQLVFSRNNRLLGRHPITEGRNREELVDRVVTFTGQSVKGPDNASVLLRLGSSAVESVPDSIWKDGNKTYTRFADPVSVDGRCQGLAMDYGKGRLVVLGEAAMLTAQIEDGSRFGMNTPGNDNRLFALNIMRWLSQTR